MKPHSRRTRRVAALAALVVGAMLVAGPAQSAGSHGKPVGPAIEAIMDKPNYRTAAWGLLEIDPAGGKVIHSSRAEEMWTSLGSPTPVGPGLYQFSDPEAVNFPRRFYQLRTP